MHVKYCFPPTLETIIFFDLFDRPVFCDELTGPLAHPHVACHGGWYFLHGRAQIVADYQKKRAAQDVLWRRACRFRSLFAFTPFVRMVAVCNSLALGTATSKSDIDLFVIADHRHFFTARLFLTAFMHLFGVRRHGAKIARRFCLSFFLADDALRIQDMAIMPTHAIADPYLAYWLRSVTPLTGYAVWQKFSAANTIFQSSQPSFPCCREPFLLWKAFQWMLELPLRTFFGAWLEKGLQHWQLQRALKKQMGRPQASIMLSPKILKFHENDRRLEIRQAFVAKCSTIGVPPNP